jgi:protoporphyrinogen oxidase
MKVAVIGAGPAGLTAAYILSKRGVKVFVYEASDSAGGLSRTFKLWNQLVDLGPHRFFSNDPRVNKIWLEIAGSDYQMVNRLTRILYNKKFFFYPLKPFNALFNLGLIEGIRCVLSFIWQKKRLSKNKSNHNTFESWVVNRFGHRLFEIFFKTYSEKLWGISCKELDSDFAAQRIKKLSLFEALLNSFLGGKGNRHKSLVDEFAYPNEGTGMIYNRMVEFISKFGGKVYYKSPVNRITLKGNSAKELVLEDGTIESFDHIISTMPLTYLVKRIENLPKAIINPVNQLKFRNTILVYLEVFSDNLFPDNWIYVHSTELKTGRVTNFRNWVPQLYGSSNTTILALEYWCNENDSLWNYDNEELIDIAKSDISKSKLIGSNKIGRGEVRRIPKCYPVYNRGYKQNLKPVQDYLDSIDRLTVIGRYGSFKYNNQDHSILMGKLAADNLTENTNHNLWDINTDYDYQESGENELSRITSPSK